MPLAVDGECGMRLVDVRNENLDAAFLAVIHDFLDLVHLREVVAQVCRLKLRGVMSLEPRCLVAHPGVAGGVGLVEGVLRELLPVLPDFVEFLLRMPVLHPSRHELFLQRVQNVYLLLSHRLAELVGLAFGEIRQFLGQKHDLLLIDRHPVGVLEVFLHFRQVVLHRLLALLAGYERRDVVHRSGAIEGVHGDEVLETGRLELLKPLHHSRRLELEDAHGVSPAVEGVCLGVVDGNRLYVNVLPVPLLDEVEAGVYDCQGVEPEEVHLEHAHILNVVPVVLRCPEFLLLSVLIDDFLVFRQADGDIVHKIPAPDDGRAGVDSHLTDAAFELKGIVQHFFCQFRAVIQLFLKLRNEPVAVL